MNARPSPGGNVVAVVIVFRATQATHHSSQASTPSAWEVPEMLIRLSNLDLDDHEHSFVRARVFGALANGTYPGQPWNRVEPLMAETWQQIRGASHLNWEDVRNEAHAA